MIVLNSVKVVLHQNDEILGDYQPRSEIHSAYTEEDGRDMKFGISAV